MSPAAKTEKREDRLPLERALRALEDAQKSLKKFSKTDVTLSNPTLKEGVRLTRHKLKKLRKRGAALVKLWDDQIGQ
jgi:exonuclease VII small subunit